MDEILCELESDKATFEFPAEAAGILRIKAKEGDTVEIGGLICVIEDSEGGEKSAPVETSAAKKTSAEAPAKKKLSVPEKSKK